ncbi:MAG: adenine phosphoribosyltransferase [Acidimicrobiales bacterium]|nr:adenine phosphoribosyltransferase [Acidimicrobiales bacterium]
MSDVTQTLLAHLRDIPDFPEPGIVFKDITPLLADADAFRLAVDALSEPYLEADVDLVVGVEARGFLFAAPIAYRIGAGCVPFRKPGKLPYETVEHTYDLEYGTDTLAAHVDALGNGDPASVLLVDDVLATGGTAATACELVESLGGHVVACRFLLELGFLSGRDRLGNHPVSSVLELR